MYRTLAHRIRLNREQVLGLQARLATLNPQATLARGYAIVQKQGVPVMSGNDVSAGDTISVTVNDGSFDAIVT